MKIASSYLLGLLSLLILTECCPAIKATENQGNLTAHQQFVRARESKIWSGFPSIVLASLFQDVETTKTLLQENADPDASGPDGITGLMYAAKFGNLEILELFLAAKSADKPARQARRNCVDLCSRE